MSHVTFYWESLNQHYHFNPNRKYMIYFRGCYCPPHGAHFKTIADFLYLDNATFFIHQGGNHRRHGVPSELSRKIWKIYISELMPVDKTILMRRTRHEEVDLAQHRSTREADVIVFIAGNENFDETITERSDREDKYRDVFKALKNKEVVFLYLNRPSNGVSATKFVQSLILHPNERSSYFRKYLPDGLSERAVSYIIRKLKECKLH